MGAVFEKSLKNFSDCHNRIPHSIFGTVAQLSYFLIAEIIQRMKKKSLSLFLGAAGQHRHNLIHRFTLANHILRSGAVFDKYLQILVGNTKPNWDTEQRENFLGLLFGPLCLKHPAHTQLGS